MSETIISGEVAFEPLLVYGKPIQPPNAPRRLDPNSYGMRKLRESAQLVSQRRALEPLIQTLRQIESNIKQPEPVYTPPTPEQVAEMAKKAIVASYTPRKGK